MSLGTKNRVSMLADQSRELFRLREAMRQIRTAIIAGAETGTIVDTLWMASGTDTVVDFIDSTLNP